MKIIDLRSDTVTQPTPAMRKAMAEADVGDDVLGEDPTVNRLEEIAAERIGKEEALFVASGTMANLVSQLTHCGRGDEMILGDRSHVFYYEQGGSAAVGGIHPRTIPNKTIVPYPRIGTPIGCPCLTSSSAGRTNQITAATVNSSGK
jgi:threonine aldolase